MGWTRARSPKRSAVSWKMNPTIMLAMPSSQAGRRARRTTSPASKPAAWLLLAPMRWHTEDVAVHKLAATASRIAVSITLSLRRADISSLCGVLAALASETTVPAPVSRAHEDDVPSFRDGTGRAAVNGQAGAPAETTIR